MSRLAPFAGYNPPPSGILEPFAVNTGGFHVYGDVAVAGGSNFLSVAYPTANLALFFPFVVIQPRTYSGWHLWNGITVSGNFDIGIYDFAGNRKVAAGSTAQAGTDQGGNFATAFLATPGMYWLAIAMDNITATLFATNTGSQFFRGCGAQQMATAFPLPATATFAAYAVSFMPMFQVQEPSWLS